MIDADYVRQMARYNAWQNRQLGAAFRALGEARLKSAGAGFFGSIFRTANHLLWGDTVWLARFTGSPLPEGGIPESPEFTASLEEQERARAALDARLTHWARGLESATLQGDLSWYSGVAGREVSRPMALCVTHFFNHQTHHRGQIHAMLTEAGAKAPVSDLVFMPGEADAP
ncbi:DinB family protein [Roseivivax sp.]